MPFWPGQLQGDIVSLMTNTGATYPMSQLSPVTTLLSMMILPSDEVQPFPRTVIFERASSGLSVAAVVNYGSPAEVVNTLSDLLDADASD